MDLVIFIINWYTTGLNHNHLTLIFIMKNLKCHLNCGEAVKNLFQYFLFQKYQYLIILIIIDLVKIFKNYCFAFLKYQNY